MLSIVNASKLGIGESVIVSVVSELIIVAKIAAAVGMPERHGRGVATLANGCGGGGNGGGVGGFGEFG